jgi:large-conductance mechanosensitive channel
MSCAASWGQPDPMCGIKTAGALIINYGIFLHVTFDFILTGFVTFMVVK